MAISPSDSTGSRIVINPSHKCCNMFHTFKRKDPNNRSIILMGAQTQPINQIGYKQSINYSWQNRARDLFNQWQQSIKILPNVWLGTNFSFNIYLNIWVVGKSICIKCVLEEQRSKNVKEQRKSMIFTTDTFRYLPFLPWKTIKSNKSNCNKIKSDYL